MPCPLIDCRNPEARQKRPADGSDTYDLDCPRCGQFSMTQTFYAASEHQFQQHPPEIMEGLRRFIKTENEDELRPLIHEANWQQRAEEYKPSVWE